MTYHVLFCLPVSLVSHYQFLLTDSLVKGTPCFHCSIPRAWHIVNAPWIHTERKEGRGKGKGKGEKAGERHEKEISFHVKCEGYHMPLVNKQRVSLVCIDPRGSRCRDVTSSESKGSNLWSPSLLLWAVISPLLAATTHSSSALCTLTSDPILSQYSIDISGPPNGNGKISRYGGRNVYSWNDQSLSSLGIDFG